MIFDTQRSRLRTVVGITVTPFDDGGAIDTDAYRRLVSRAVEGGLSAITPNGNTSEFYSLSAAERLLAVQLTLEASGDAMVVPGVGFDHATASEDIARYQRLGVSCVMIHQPVHPFMTSRGWVDHHLALARRFPEMGFVPYVRNACVGAVELRQLIAEAPGFVGIKYSVPDSSRFAALVAEVGPDALAWLCGLAETWAPYFALGGAQGFTSGLVNVDPQRCMRMFSALQTRGFDAAMQEWLAVREFEELRARNNSEFNVSVVKEALSQLGLCGPDVRAPVTRVPEADRTAITRILAEWEVRS